MLNGIYSVFDIKARDFAPVFQCRNDAVAIRMFEQSLNSDKVVLVKSDFRLYRLAFVDIETGAVSESGPQEVFTAGEFDDKGAPVGKGG